MGSKGRTRGATQAHQDWRLSLRGTEKKEKKKRKKKKKKETGLRLCACVVTPKNTSLFISTNQNKVKERKKIRATKNDNVKLDLQRNRKILVNIKTASQPTKKWKTPPPTSKRCSSEQKKTTRRPARAFPRPHPSRQSPCCAPKQP